MAYGVANQALLYSYDTRPDWIIRRVFYRPYMHIYGQIPLDEIDGVCVFVSLLCYFYYTVPSQYTFQNYGVCLLKNLFSI